MKLLHYPQDKTKLLIPGKLISLAEIQTQDFLEKIEKMKEILDMDGMGLAATQVGWSVQLFLLCQNQELQECEPQAFINPKILNTSKVKEKATEGCLSFQGLYLKLKRPSEVEWEYTDLQGKEHKIISTGYYARAVQHEIDHLNGRVFIFKASAAQKLKINRWLKTIGPIMKDVL